MKDDRPSIPEAVARQLRQEAGYGCARCGFPFVEYHHIVPWTEEHHFRASDMVAVCPNCHVAFDRDAVSRERQYEIKHDPYNIRNGMVNGSLVYDGAGGISIGGNIFTGTQYYIAYDGKLMLGYGVNDNEHGFYCNISDESGESILLIEWNSFMFSPADIWDFVFKTNYIKAQHKARDIFFEIDFRTSPASLKAELFCGSCKVSIQSGSMKIETKDGKFKETHANNIYGAPPLVPCLHFVTEQYCDSLRGEQPLGAMFYPVTPS